MSGKIEYIYLNVESGANIDGYIKRKDSDNIQADPLAQEAEIEFIPQIETIIAANKENDNNVIEQEDKTKVSNSNEKTSIDDVPNLSTKKKRRRKEDKILSFTPYIHKNTLTY